MRYCKCGETEEAAYSPSRWKAVIGLDKRRGAQCRKCVRASDKKYRKSEKGRATKRKYFMSEWGQAKRRKYFMSEKGKAARRRYKDSLPPGCYGFDRYDLENDREMRREYNREWQRRLRAGQCTSLRDRRKYGMEDERDEVQILY